MPIATFVLLALIALVSWLAFKDRSLFERLLFDPARILAGRQYPRILSCALVHVDAGHLLFNGISLYFFASAIETHYGAGVMLLAFLASVLGGSVLSLLIHRHHEYRAAGASGGVCGVIFAAVFLFPGMSLYLFFVPIPIPGWLFAIAYLLISFYGMQRGVGNIGHDAHIGGALTGVLAALLVEPRIAQAQPLLFTGVVLLGLALLVYLWLRPGGLMPARIAPQRQPAGSSAPHAKRYSNAHRERSRKINAILEKVSKHGYDSLSPGEKRELDTVSRKERSRRK